MRLFLALLCLAGAAWAFDDVHLSGIIHGVAMQGDGELDRAAQTWHARFWSERQGLAQTQLELGGTYLVEADGSFTLTSEYGPTTIRLRPLPTGEFAFVSGNRDFRLTTIAPRGQVGPTGPVGSTGPTGPTGAAAGTGH